jgi:hypothetical protein
MKTVPVPGGPGVIRTPVCLQYNEPLRIVFTADGSFSHDDIPPAFTPPLPTGGFLYNNLIGPYIADNKHRTFTLTFDSGGTPYYYDVTIQAAPCK